MGQKYHYGRSERAPAGRNLNEGATKFLLAILKKIWYNNNVGFSNLFPLLCASGANYLIKNNTRRYVMNADPYPSTGNGHSRADNHMQIHGVRITKKRSA
ncbi:unknown [Ruminococcus sp. CAG:403]|nr:unknown [Ruminococcus sp. CAG:403]